MADPKIDQGFVEDSQGRTDILRSPFFDLNLDVDGFVEEYVDRILFQLSTTIDQHYSSNRWSITSPPPISPTPATSPANTTVGIIGLLVASLGSYNLPPLNLYYQE